MSGDVNYTLKVPQIGGRIDVLPRYQDEIRSTGQIAAVVDKGLVDDLETFTVTTEAGERMTVVVLEPDSSMDNEAERCYLLLSWHRSTPRGEEGDSEPVRIGILKRVAAGFIAQIQDRPLVVLGLIVIGVGVIFLLIGNTRLGEAFIDLGVKVFLTLGALFHSVVAATPAILNDVSDWIQPVRFLSGFAV